MIVRFVKVVEKEGAKFLRDQEYPTKRAAIRAIRQAGANPGPRILEGGRRIRVALLPVG
jgi:hypothetical protein